jgi:hypothetical protein
MFMKNVLVKVSSVAALCAMFGTSNAIVEGCTGNEIHCIQTTGLSQSPDDGRFVKLTLNEGSGSFSSTACIPGIPDGIGFEEDDVYEGNYSLSFAICQDISGNNCQNVSTDNVEVTGDWWDGYVANPKVHNIDFTPYVASYAKCTVTQDDRRRLARAFK